MENDVDKIEKLIIMRDQGILSEQEYQNQLNVILKKSIRSPFNLKILGIILLSLMVLGGGYFSYNKYLFDKNKAIIGVWEIEQDKIFNKNVGTNFVFEFTPDNKVYSKEYFGGTEPLAYFINEDKVIIAEPLNANAMTFWFINKDVIATSFNYQQIPVTVKFTRK